MPRRFSIELDKDYFNFASAHFLIFADGRREALHGHNYQVSVAIEGELDRAGVVLDFITLKPIVKRLCDQLDHRTLIQEGHPSLAIRRDRGAIQVRYRDQRLLLPKRDVILLPIANTSTELLAEHIARKLRRRLSRDYPDARLSRIEIGVEETRGQRGFFRGEF